MPSSKRLKHGKNDRRVVFAPRRLKAWQRHLWSLYFRALLEFNTDWLEQVSYVYAMRIRKRGGSYMRGIRGFYAATNTLYGTWGISSGMTTYPLHYWTATTS